MTLGKKLIVLTAFGQDPDLDEAEATELVEAVLAGGLLLYQHARIAEPDCGHIQVLAWKMMRW